MTTAVSSSSSRSPSELCRYIRNADPAQVPSARLEAELAREEILSQIRLRAPNGAGTAAPSQPLPRIQTIADRLALPYGDALRLVTQYLRQRHTSSSTEPEPAALFAIYHQERYQLYLLIAILLQTSGDAAHPYCSAARNVITRCPDLLDAVLERYRFLSQVTTAPALSSPDLIRAWADDVVQQQTLLLQIVLAHLAAVRSRPTPAQVGAVLDLYGAQQLSGGWPLYTLLSADGRRLSRTLAALWLQVFLRLMQPQALVARCSGADAPFQALIQDPIGLDQRLFARLSPTLAESAPMRLSWAVHLCLLYQCVNRGVALPGLEALNAGHVPDLQNRVLAHLSSALRLDVFAGLRSVLALVDADPHLDVAGVLGRGALHDLLAALARADVQNVLVRALPDYFDAHLAPLYESVLDGHPELTDRIWAEIETASQGPGPSPFPLFDDAFIRFRQAMGERRLIPLPSVRYAECAVLLRLLGVMAASPIGAERALRVLDAAEPDCLRQLQGLFGSVVSAGLFGVADRFLVEFARLTLRLVLAQDSGLSAVIMPPALIDSVCLALQSIKLETGSFGALVETLLGLLCHVPRYEAALSRQLQRVALPDLAHLFLYQIDVGTGDFRCTVHVVRLLERLLAQSEADLRFPLDEYAPLCRRLLDFVCDDVFVLYDSWRFASEAARWALGEALFALFASLLGSDDLRAQLLLRGQLGHRLALRLCNEAVLHRVLFHAIVTSRDRLAFGSPTRVKDAVARLVGAAFRVVQALMTIRTDGLGRDRDAAAALNDALLETCFGAGLDSARLAQTFVLYLDLPEYQWARHAIVVLTRLLHLSARLNVGGAGAPPVTVVGLLSQSRAVDVSGTATSPGDAPIASLKAAVARLLQLDVAFLVSATLEFLVAALRHQPGLAERLLEGSGETRPDLLALLHDLLEQKRDDRVVFQQSLSVFAELWRAAVRYRSVSTSMIADRVVHEFGARFWSAVAFALTHPIAADSEPERLASLRARSDAFQIVAIEFAYANDLSAVSSLIAPMRFDLWLHDLLPTPEQWAAFGADLRQATADGVAQWKLFLNAILLNAAAVLDDDVRRRHRSALIVQVLSLEGIPLSVVKDGALLLVALNYHTPASLSADDLAALIRALSLWTAAFDNGTRLRTPDLAVYALICDSILSVCHLQAIRHGASSTSWPDDVVRIGARLTALDQSGFMARHLPGLIEHSALSAAIPEVTGAIQSLAARQLSSQRPAADGFARLKIFLMFVLSVSVQARGSDLLVSIGILSTISNSWIRASIGDLMRRHTDLWCLIVDCATALLVASPTSPLLHRQLIEFVVVFRHPLQVTVQAPLQVDNLQLAQRSMVLCYEIGHVAGRFRDLPVAIVDEQRALQCQTCFTLARLLTSSMYAPPARFARQQWLAVHVLAVTLAFVRSQQARTLADLFSFDLSARSDPPPGAPLPLSFIVDLIDYCVASLGAQARQSVAFIQERLAAFDQIHKFVLEHALFILVDFASFHIRAASEASPYLADYLQEMTRIRRVLESAQVLLGTADDLFLGERVLGPVVAIEADLHRLVQRKAAAPAGPMQLDSAPRWPSHSRLLLS